MSLTSNRDWWAHCPFYKSRSELVGYSGESARMTRIGPYRVIENREATFDDLIACGCVSPFLRGGRDLLGSISAINFTHRTIGRLANNEVDRFGSLRPRSL